MTAEELRSILKQRQVKFSEQPLQHGVQFRCTGGEIFTVFETGRISIQGQQTPLSDLVKGADESGSLGVTALEQPERIRQPPNRRLWRVRTVASSSCMGMTTQPAMASN